VLTTLPESIAWRAVLALNLPFIIATLLLTIRFIPRPTRTTRRVDLDLPGITLVGAFVLLVTMPVIDPGIGGIRLWGIVVGVAAGFLQLAQRLSATFCVALVTGVMLTGDLETVTPSGLQHGLLICSGLVLTACVLSFSAAPRSSPNVHAALADTAQITISRWSR
jgi:hypothetical protein